MPWVRARREPGLVKDHVQGARPHQEPHQERGPGAQPLHHEHFHHFHHTLPVKPEQGKVNGALIWLMRNKAVIF